MAWPKTPHTRLCRTRSFLLQCCRSEFFWHLCADPGLACEQAATLCTQAVGHSYRRSARAPSITLDCRAPALENHFSASVCVSDTLLDLCILLFLRAL